MVGLQGKIGFHYKTRHDFSHGPLLRPLVTRFRTAQQQPIDLVSALCIIEVALSHRGDNEAHAFAAKDARNTQARGPTHELAPHWEERTCERAFPTAASRRAPRLASRQRTLRQPRATRGKHACPRQLDDFFLVIADA